MGKRKHWQNYEKTVATKHRGRHIGGPRQPDYTRGDIHGEAKLRNRPLNRPEVMSECRKGRKEIVCNKGFTSEARQYVKRYRPNVKLIHHP
jgi:hypothetical protein